MILANILLVEDDLNVLRQNKKLLEKMGHQVTAFSSPEEAVQLDNPALHKIDLLISDIVLPSMNGNKLFQILKKRHPRLKILFTSGYTADYIHEHGLIESDICFIQKPFTLENLSQGIQTALSGKEI